jgi:threonine synthase
MRYISTRGQATPLGFSDAVATGLAPDGGLFLPEQMPELAGRVREWEGLPYAELCFKFLRVFADEYPGGNFARNCPAQLHPLHGPGDRAAETAHA